MAFLVDDVSKVMSAKSVCFPPKNFHCITPVSVTPFLLLKMTLLSKFQTEFCRDVTIMFVDDNDEILSDFNQFLIAFKSN